MNTFNILVLAGYSGAGKTTIAKEISRSHNIGFIEHQQLIHKIAVSKGYTRARYWLKNVGLNEFVNESTKEICIKLANFQESGLTGAVMDVAYGKRMLMDISKNIPVSEICVVSVCTDEKTREFRIAGRMGGVERDTAYGEREFRDSFLKDTGLQEVIDSANFEIINNGDVNDTIDQLYRGLELRHIKI